MLLWASKPDFSVIWWFYHRYGSDQAQIPDMAQIKLVFLIWQDCPITKYGSDQIVLANNMVLTRLIYHKKPKL